LSTQDAASRRIIIFEYCAVVLLAAGILVVMKAALECGWGKATLGFVRFAVGAVVFACYFVVTGRKVWPEQRRARAWLCAAALLKSSSMFFFLWALENASASYVAIVLAAGPLVGMIYSHFLFRDDPLTRRRAAGVCISIAGVAVLVALQGASDVAVGGRYAGAAYAVCALLLVRALPIADKKALQHGATVAQTAFFSIVPVAVFFLVCLLIAGEKWPELGRPAPLLLGIGVTLSLIAIIPLRRSLVRKVKISSLMLADNIVPVARILMAFVFLHERMTPLMLACMAAVFAGIMLGRAPAARPPDGARTREEGESGTPVVE